MEKLQGKIPQVRFPEYKDAWEHKKLSDLLSEAKKRNEDLKYGKDEVLSVSGELGIVNQIEHLGRSYAGASVHQYHVVEVGDIVYTKSPLKENPYGIIKLNKGKAGIVSTLYAVYKVNTKFAYGQFIDCYFSLDANTNRYLRPLVKKGAKNDMKISNAYVLHDRIFVPSLSEQIKISNLLTEVDGKLTQLKKKKSLLERYKKGVIQKLFSQELRFKDENRNNFVEWEEKELGDIASKVITKNKNNSITNVFTNSASQGIVNQRDYFDKDIANQNNLQGYYIVLHNDFIYNPRISNLAPVGPIKRNHLDSGVMSPLYSIFRFKEGNLNFFEQYFNSTYWHDYMCSIANYGARADRMNITSNEFYQMPVSYPCQKEQLKIANFLSAIDDKISHCAMQIEKMEGWKKGLLQGMFV